MSAVQAFLSYLQVERRMSAHTLDAYQRDLAALTQWCEAHDVADPQILQGDQLREFVASEHRRGLSAKSLQRRLSACRSFYAWLLKNNVIDNSPAAGLRLQWADDSWVLMRPSRAGATVRVYAEAPTEEERDELLEAACDLVRRGV